MGASREQYKVEHDVFDEFTKRTLHKLSSQGYFEELVSDIMLGKEAHIFSAVTKNKTYVIVKIYRLENCNFNKMFSYISHDPRYQDIKGKKRQIIFAWVKREFRNLLAARQAGVRVPTPFVFENNVLVMELVGNNEQVAKQAKNATIDDPQAFIDECVVQMKKLYGAELVHADLSMFNILVDNQQPVFIDMSQTTHIEDSSAKEYLKRDIANVASFAKRLQVTLDQDKVFEEIISVPKSQRKLGNPV